MLRKIFRLLPEQMRELIRITRDGIISIFYRGKGRYCPVCGKESKKFIRYGIIARDEAKCTHCGALERHRFVWAYFQKETNLFDKAYKKVLHVAPERCFEHRLRNLLGQNYITADLSNPRAMVKMDITNIQYPDETFDVIYCSHVLEHVQDDIKALREFCRVMKQDGWAILLVPIDAEKTFEDATIVDPSERLRVFGNSDHVRLYGPDYIDRLREAGFKVKVSNVSELFGKDEIVTLGLTKGSGEIYYCTK